MDRDFFAPRSIFVIGTISFHTALRTVRKTREQGPPIFIKSDDEV